MVMWSTVLIVSLAITAQVIADDCDETLSCGPNEVISKNSNCRKTCNLRTRDPDCVEKLGCMCDLNNGFLYNSKGVCVPRGECDAPCEGDLGKVFDPCGNSCPKTCDNMNDPNWSCTPYCSAEGACKCIDGLVQNLHGNCVIPGNCEKQCPQYESYSECLGNGCENTCEEPNKRTNNCPDPFCRTGCVCSQDWVRDCNGQCIPPKLCGASCDGDSNSYLSQCATICDNWKCSDIKDRAEEIGCGLTGQCSNVKACICKPGYYRQDGRCIPQKDCPKCDGANEEFLCRRCELKCGGVIDQSCLNEEGCVEGCYCKKGYARNCDGVCVPLSKCEQYSCNGDPNAYFEQCDVRCQKTCEFRDGPPICTPGVCVKTGGCVCKENFVLGPNGKCIPPAMCDYSQKSILPPPTAQPIPKCCKNEHVSTNPYVECADQTCDMYFKGENPKCTYHNTVCKPVCKCKPAYARNHNGECVLHKDCCQDPNAMVKAGPVACPGGTCKNPEFEKCTKPWQPFSCHCKPGYLKKSDCDPTCIPACECPKCK